MLRAHIGFECEPATLGDVAGVDVAPQVPAAHARVVPIGREVLVVVRLHDVGKAERNVRRAGPPMQLPAELLGEQLRERVARFRVGGMFLVDWRVGGLLALERQAEDRFARCPDDAMQAEQPRRLEDVVRADGVCPEGRLLGPNPRRRDRRKVNDSIRTRQALDGLAEVGQIGEQKRRR